MGKRGPGRLMRFVGYVRRRQAYVAVGLGLALVAVVLTSIGDSLASPWHDLSVNLAADLVGTMVVLFMVGPVFDRAARNEEQVLPRLSHEDLLAQMAESKDLISILELWTDLLDSPYERRFQLALEAALDRGAKVQILLLDPSNPAAEQRARELGRNDVAQSIMNNLVKLHTIRRRLADDRRERFQVRVYSQLPSAQVYRVDNHILASFFPTRVPSWESPQHQTRPQHGLGLFLVGQFDGLWEGAQTRDLDQFRSVSLREAGQELDVAHARFVITDNVYYVGGTQDLQDVINRKGVDQVRVCVVDRTALGREQVLAPARLELLPTDSTERHAIYGQFQLKYGERFQSVIYRLSELPPDT